MQIVVLSNDAQRQALTGDTVVDGVTWTTNENAFFTDRNAGIFIDLAFEANAPRIERLVQLLPNLVVVNSVASPLAEIHSDFVRINGWTTALSSPMLEGACLQESLRQKAEDAFTHFGKKIEWLVDSPGFVSARVVSMIINEAYLALAEGVSTKTEINTAMKLGTAYPYGPFEWAEHIGLSNLVLLLQKLSETQVRYQPAGLLLEEANAS